MYYEFLTDDNLIEMYN